MSQPKKVVFVFVVDVVIFVVVFVVVVVLGVIFVAVVIIVGPKLNLKLSKPQLNHNSTQPNITLSWVRHENDFANHPYKLWIFTI